MTVELLREIMRQWLAERVDAVAQGNQTRFAHLTGTKGPDINRAINGKGGRGVSLDMLARISSSAGPSMHQILAELANRCALAETEAIVRGEARAAPPSKRRARPGARRS